jgi:hypothetical protein
MDVLQVTVGREIMLSEVVLQVLLLTFMLKTKHRFRLSIKSSSSSWHWLYTLLIMQEALSEAAVEGLLSEGPTNKVEAEKRLEIGMLLYCVETIIFFWGANTE